jgi:hypothetical protein
MRFSYENLTVSFDLIRLAALQYIENIQTQIVKPYCMDDISVLTSAFSSILREVQAHITRR